MTPCRIPKPPWTSWLATAALALAVAATAAAGSLGEESELRSGETVSYDEGALSLTFEGVSRDNRCPKGVQCIVAGEAVVELTAEAGGAHATLTFKVPGRDPSQDFGGYTITVTAVDPQTRPGRQIAPEDYVVRLVVERSASSEAGGA